MADPQSALAMAMMNMGNRFGGQRRYDPKSAQGALYTKLAAAGTDASPVGHWTQALARVMQGGLGGYMTGKSIADEDEGMKSLAEVMGKPNVSEEDIRAAAIKAGYPDIAIQFALAKALTKQQAEAQGATFDAMRGGRGGPQTAGGPTGAGGDPNVHPPEYNNNVGNLTSTNTPWAGKGAPYANKPAGVTFETFADPVAGVAAAYKNLQYHASRGADTLEKLGAAWLGAPDVNTPNKHGNKPRDWAAAVALAAGLNPGDPLPLNDPQAMARVMAGINKIEHGRLTVPPEAFVAGVTGQPMQGTPAGGQSPQTAMPGRPTPQVGPAGPQVAQAGGPPAVPQPSQMPGVTTPPPSGGQIPMGSGPIPAELIQSNPQAPPGTPLQYKPDAPLPPNPAGMQAGAAAGSGIGGMIGAGMAAPLPPIQLTPQGGLSIGPQAPAGAPPPAAPPAPPPQAQPPVAPPQAPPAVQPQGYQFTPRRNVDAEEAQLLYQQAEAMRNKPEGVALLAKAQEAERKARAFQNDEMIRKQTEARAFEADQRAQANADRQAAAAAKQDTKLTESQAKAYAFAQMVGPQIPILESLVMNPDGTPRKEAPSSISRALPGGINLPFGVNIPTNWMAGPEGQKFSAARQQIIDALLRFESGATIQDPEFQRKVAEIVPQPNDKPEVVIQKLRSLRTQWESLARISGREGEFGVKPAGAGQFAIPPMGAGPTPTGPTGGRPDLRQKYGLE